MRSRSRRVQAAAKAALSCKWDCEWYVRSKWGVQLPADRRALALVHDGSTVADSRPVVLSAYSEGPIPPAGARLGGEPARCRCDSEAPDRLGSPRAPGWRAQPEVVRSRDAPLRTRQLSLDPPRLRVLPLVRERQCQVARTPWRLRRMLLRRRVADSEHPPPNARHLPPPPALDPLCLSVPVLRFNLARGRPCQVARTRQCPPADAPR